MSEQLPQVKAVATVRDVARMVGLSVPRFYKLQREGVFSPPVYDLRTRRPFYTEEQQRECLEVRRRNVGVNGRTVLFYARRVGSTLAGRSTVKKRRAAQVGPSASRHDEAVHYLRGLGLHRVTPEQIDVALRSEFPSGTDGVERGTVLGRLFVYLHRHNSADKAGT